jgi:FSR family fosmidomycin resistance protein-like MFS transporter
MASHNMSYAAAASLVFAANVSSSIIQPLFGYFADKIAVPWIMPLGILLAGAGLALTGLTSNYWLIFAAVAVSGIGVAAYHPEGARLANIAAGEKKGTGVSMFTAGGNIGLAAGPLIATFTLTALGLKGTLVLLLPVGIVAALFLLSLGNIRKCQQTAEVSNIEAISTQQKAVASDSFFCSSCVCRAAVVMFAFKSSTSLCTLVKLCFTSSVVVAMEVALSWAAVAADCACSSCD